MSDNTTTKQQTSFLDLPPELRNIIYEESGCLRVVKCPSCSSRMYASHIEDHVCPHFKFLQRFHIRAQNDVEKFKATRVVIKDGTRFVEGWKFDKKAVREHNLFKPASLCVKHAWAGQPALTRVCRSIRAETIPMFYASNHFFAVVPQYLLDWCTVLGPERAKWLRSVKLCGRWDEKEILEKLKGSGLNLEKCVVEFERW